LSIVLENLVLEVLDCRENRARNWLDRQPALNYPAFLRCLTRSTRFIARALFQARMIFLEARAHQKDAHEAAIELVPQVMVESLSCFNRSPDVLQAVAIEHENEVG